MFNKYLLGNRTEPVRSHPYEHASIDIVLPIKRLVKKICGSANGEGDHAKNLMVEVVQLVTGQSMYAKAI